MIEFVYWHWLVLGIGLIALEMVLPSFIALWFGLAACVVGILLLFIPMSLTLQVLLWTVFSIGFTALWFKFIKPLATDKTTAGLPAEKIIHETGMVIKLPIEGEKGMLRFSTPKLGNDEWLFNSDDQLTLGDRVRVTAVEGNSLIVIKS